MSDPKRSFKHRKNKVEIKQRIWVKYENIIINLCKKRNNDIYQTERQAGYHQRISDIRKTCDKAVRQAENDRQREYYENSLI